MLKKLNSLFFVHLDEHLNWKPHISSDGSKLQRANGILSKIRHNVPLKSLINIYHGIFGSHIRYASQIWGLYDNTVTHRILTLQKTAVRLITFSNPRSPSLLIFSELELLKFFDLVEVINILLIHQHFNENLPSDTLATLNFDKIQHSIGTRGNILGLLRPSNVKTYKYGINSLTRLTIQQWNKLQQHHTSINLSNLNAVKIKITGTQSSFI